MSNVCVHCSARSWPGESINCCDNGAIILPVFPAAPPPLAVVMYTNHVQDHIRAYNMALSMASVGHKSRSLNYGAFILGGKTYHRIGSMQPDAGGSHSFAQIYVLDVNEATDRRCDVTKANIHPLCARFCFEVHVTGSNIYAILIQTLYKVKTNQLIK